MDEPAESAQATLDQLEALLPLLDQAGFSRDMCAYVLSTARQSCADDRRVYGSLSYEDFYEPLRDLVRKFASGNGSPSSKPTPEDILSEFNDAEKSNSTVVFLRLLTSAYLKANADEFAPVRRRACPSDCENTLIPPRCLRTVLVRARGRRALHRVGWRADDGALLLQPRRGAPSAGLLQSVCADH